VLTDNYRPRQTPLPWAYSRLVQAPEVIGRQIGSLLLDQYTAQPLTSHRVILPVTLITPDA